MSTASAFRLYKSNHAATAFSGYGAKKYGGRWNPPGLAMVYSSSSLALAQLETLVHLNGPLPPDGFELLELSIPQDCIGRRIRTDDMEEYGIDWRTYPSHLLLQEIGADWIASSQSSVMEVPSAVSPEDSNFLLNPAHADFQRIEIVRTAPLVWDIRLIELSKGF